jgi:hypothetical protein
MRHTPNYSQPDSGRYDAALNKRHRLDAGNVEPLPASQILAHGLRIHQNHVALCFGKLRTIPLIAPARQHGLLRPHHPLQVVGILRAARWAIQHCRLRRLRFRVIVAFVHLLTAPPSGSTPCHPDCPCTLHAGESVGCCGTAPVRVPSSLPCAKPRKSA